jgi:hypothetical protein
MDHIVSVEGPYIVGVQKYLAYLVREDRYEILQGEFASKTPWGST